ncbi:MULTISPECIES: helix-turn-helix transcriptional regulator [unclassified Polaromonas]|jgi:transcriptional regulator with XRE-family HTH domain|uniref:helix-turn-helix domain-containing protein n=1 Tax=unclassified Polaromonas TaxID=2638319 RepID=UPI000BD2039E|nr:MULTISPECIES: helix-turn-helix transcriptional regulator [unclassified Polaromonas]OYY37083.1 MAG: hypothetical protein B7Y60_08915 [Polaromonas sp. 35-63-35]OYZ13584.1 MAG: hypothetical protein B7Y28_23420 [Polaromonas sp. 16-63-31]OYZ78839.1 MAG: hypothetical protein B7Y09_11180 [Polaromonas sp. 24-63-21]OZA49647.1 MAG: hypothetical protein B7X88_14650 [Polaromonas sp. 17-63-33]OZA86809.1 MAG: hypothetical protein B7X65_15170 [Polaromonas sp. 39-63-25]
MSHDEIFFEAGQRIAELRGDLTQAAFAERLGVDRKTVVGWEAGKRLPDGSSLLALARQFGADVNYILTGRAEVAAGALQPRERALLDNYKHSGKEGQRAIERVAMLEAKQPEISVKKAERKAA